MPFNGPQRQFLSDHSFEGPCIYYKHNRLKDLKCFKSIVTSPGSCVLALSRLQLYLLPVSVAEVHVADHQHPVHHHRPRDQPGNEGLQWFKIYHTVNRLRSFLSLGHWVTRSLGHLVTRSLGHSVTRSLSHSIT